MMIAAPVYQLIRSKRKTMALYVRSDGSLEVRAPLKTAPTTLDAFVLKHSPWIIKKQAQNAEHAAAKAENALSQADIAALKHRAKEVLPPRTLAIGKTLGLVPSSVKITSATTRWGSCSGKNAICYSYRLLLLPAELQDYVIYHELCHIKEKNHGKGFYALLNSLLPDYRQREIKLKAAPRQLGI